MTATAKAFQGFFLALPFVISACGQQASETAASAAVDEDSPAYQAYDYRHGLMHVIAFKMGRIRAMAQGEMPVDDAVFREYALDLSALAPMIPEGFPEGSGGIPGSRAMPEVWSNWADFEQKAQDFEAATVALADAAESGTLASSQQAIENTAQACGACHRPYRAEEG